MNIDFFADPGLSPKPRAEIRIEELSLQPYSDGRRVRVEMQLTPFAPADRPNIEITVQNRDGTEVASLSIIETVHRVLGVTIHLREPEPQGQYEFVAELYYPEQAVQHTVRRTLTS
jgi:hypothetical protein